MEERRLTVRDKIIIHLAGYSRFADDFECPEEMAQAGISASIGKSRAHTTLELNRMKEAHLITERLAHVKNARSKRKTYTLAPDAFAREREILDDIRRMEIEVQDSGKAGTMNGQQAAEILMKELSMSRTMAFDTILKSRGIINVDVEMEGMGHASDGGDKPRKNRTFDAMILQANILSRKGRPGEALEVLDKAMMDELSVVETARLHYSRASIFRKQGDYPAAIREIDTALERAIAAREKLMTARCQMEKAMILAHSGSSGELLELLDAAEESFRRENSQIDLLRCGINQGIILRGMGNTNEALSVLEDSLERAERASMGRLRAYALVNLTDLLNEMGEYERSIELASSAGDIFQVLDEPLMLAASMFNMGTAQAALGNKRDAIINLDRAIFILEKNGITRRSWLENYAAILKQLGEQERAAKILSGMDH